MGTVTENYETAAGVLKFVAEQVGKYYFGPIGESYATFVTGQNTLVASFADLMAKMKAGTAKPEDFAEVGNEMSTLLVAFGRLAGKVDRRIETIVSVIDGALFVWNLRDKVGYKDGDITTYLLDNLVFSGDGYDSLFDPNNPNDGTNGPSQDGREAALEPAGLGRVDPLAFDLGGFHGIDTTGSGNRIVFDHNADGVKNGTGWLREYDAWLALDKDGNGTIDNGPELFGDNTIKSNGESAQNGFDALADWDVNADGIIDAQDEIFTELRLWRDLNQDGISQSEELLTLSDLNIASINLQNTKNNTNLNGTGNVQTLAANLFILF
jgi:hypothetical protein